MRYLLPVFRAVPNRLSGTNAFVALGLLLLLGACSKDNPAPTPIPASSWQVDGQQQQSDSVAVQVNGATASTNPNTIEIKIWQTFKAPTSIRSAVVVHMYVPNAVGTYSLAGKDTKASAGYSDYVTAGSGSNLYLSTSGSITISSLTSTSIAGTFSFTGAEMFNDQHTKRISNGQFNKTF